MPDQVALFLSRPMSWVVAVLGPLALAIEHLVRAMLRPFGVRIGEATIEDHRDPVLDLPHEFGVRGARDPAELAEGLDPDLFWQVHRGLIVRASAIARAHSGNHWSQQMPTPMRPNAVSHTLKPVSPGVK